MSKLGEYFMCGKLQVARSIVGELSRLYTGSQIAFEFRTAWYALNRADAAIIAEVEKPSPNKRVIPCRKKKKRVTA